MKLEYVLLSLLAQRPYSGYDLRKWLETEGQFLWSRAHHSQIYRALRTMESGGWVVHQVDPREGRPDAKVYRMTETGRGTLLAWVRSPYEPTSRFQEVDFVARFSITVPLDREAAVRLIRTELAYRREQIGRNRGRDRELHFEDPMPELDQELTRQVHEELHQLGARAVDRWVEWLERMELRVTEGKSIR